MSTTQATDARATDQGPAGPDPGTSTPVGAGAGAGPGPGPGGRARVGAGARPGGGAAAGGGLRRGALISGLAVLGSRVMGLLREQIFAFLFGASREYDAFITAFRIPNLLRDLLAEGALSSAFVTTYVQAQKDGRQRAFYVANAVVNVLVVVLLGVTILGILGAVPLVQAMALGFDADKVALTVTLTRLMFPFILFLALAAIAMGMLNAAGQYGVPQSASTVFNLVSILMGLSLASLLAPETMRGVLHGQPMSMIGGTRAMWGMAGGTLLGGLAQFLFQVPALRALGYRWRPVWDLQDTDFRRVLRLMGPAVIGAAAVQVNVFVNSNFASTLGDRAISWLNYAFRLMQFPIGVFGVAVMTAALPALARQSGDGAAERAGFAATMAQALELVILLTLPAALGLWCLGEPIIALIYQHGRFTAADTRATAQALAAYAVGLPAYAALKILQPAFVALGDARTPMRVSLMAVGVNIGLNFLLVRQLGAGHVGLALSTSGMALGNALALLGLLQRRGGNLPLRRMGSQLLRMGGASGAMLITAQALHLRLGGPGSLAAARELALALPACVCVYGLSAHLLGVGALRAGLRQLRRRQS